MPCRRHTVLAVSSAFIVNNQSAETSFIWRMATHIVKLVRIFEKLKFQV